ISGHSAAPLGVGLGSGALTPRTPIRSCTYAVLARTRRLDVAVKEQLHEDGHVTSRARAVVRLKDNGFLRRKRGTKHRVAGQPLTAVEAKRSFTVVLVREKLRNLQPESRRGGRN